MGVVVLLVLEVSGCCGDKERVGVVRDGGGGAGGAEGRGGAGGEGGGEDSAGGGGDEVLAVERVEERIFETCKILASVEQMRYVYATFDLATVANDDDVVPQLGTLPNLFDVLHRFVDAVGDRLKEAALGGTEALRADAELAPGFGRFKVDPLGLGEAGLLALLRLLVGLLGVLLGEGCAGGGGRSRGSGDDRNLLLCLLVFWRSAIGNESRKTGTLSSDRGGEGTRHTIDLTRLSLVHHPEVVALSLPIRQLPLGLAPLLFLLLRQKLLRLPARDDCGHVYRALVLAKHVDILLINRHIVPGLPGAWHRHPRRQDLAYWRLLERFHPLGLHIGEQ